MIKVSTPGKIHLLGEWSAIWGKPAVLAAVDRRIYISVQKSSKREAKIKLQEVVEQVLQDRLKIKIPNYKLEIKSNIPLGAGLGSSAASSACLIAALLTLIKYNWDKNLINELAFEAEKVFHGNPSGGDNSTVVFGGLIWFTRTNFEKLNLGGFRKLAKNFVLINTGAPKETTRQMITITEGLFDQKPKLKERFLESQGQLVKDLLPAIQTDNEKEFIRIIRAGERNLESIGVVSPYAKAIIRKVENMGGAAKICGGGGKEKATGVLLCYHKDRNVIEQIAKSYNLPYFSVKLGIEGVKVL